MSTLSQRMVQLLPARRKRVEERAKALIAGEMSLRDLRRARNAQDGRRTRGSSARRPTSPSCGSR